jgi:long-chain acyl-CoA synthetase
LKDVEYYYPWRVLMKNSMYSLYKVDCVNNLKELIENSAFKYPDNIAFEYKNKDNKAQKVSYKQFKSDIECLGTAIYSIGLKDRHIAVIGENSYEWIVTYIATVNSSNVIVPIDKELTAKEIRNILIDSESKALIFSDLYSETVLEIQNDLAEVRYFINTNAESDNDKFICYQGLLERGRQLISQGDRSFIDNQVDSNMMAAIIYTSGTTGVSKGVMLSHQNISSNVVSALNNVKPYEETLLVLPIHHTFGITAGVFCILHSGYKICINSNLKRVSNDIKEYKPGLVFLVPLFVETMYKKIWSTAEKSGKANLLRTLIKVSNFSLRMGIDLRRKLFKSVLSAFGGELRLIVCGGAPLDPKYIKGFRDFGINVLNGYGITECSPIVSVNRNQHYKDGSIGQVLTCCEVNIDNPDSNGEGEILVKGQNVMMGYYKNDKATKDAMEDGWFRTGDIGRLDEDGFLYITGRKKNLIILNNGKNIYPEEIEMLIVNIPYVKEVMVYSECDLEEKETTITAEVYLDSEYIEAKGINDPKDQLQKDIDMINKTIPYYKNISEVRIRETEFDKTTTKKIKRFKAGGVKNA